LDYQVIVIGAGPGGYPAALKAARMGAKVCIVESEQVGGTCLNRGCIPTKALVESASALRRARRAAEFGVETGAVSLNYGRVRERQSEIVDRLRDGVRLLLKNARVELIQARGRLAGRNQVELAGAGGMTGGGKAERITGDRIILATGSEPLLPQGLGYDGEVVLSSTELLWQEELPESLLIVGGGVIGCEFAGICSAMGVRVTLVEAQPTVLPFIEEDLARKLQSSLKQQGVDLKTKTRILNVARDGRQARVSLSDGSEVAADRVLIAVGRSLNTAEIGLEQAGVATGSGAAVASGAVVVNDNLETSVPGIYAVGDITGKALLAHVATAQGTAAAANALGEARAVDYGAVPNCIFTYPEIGSVGITSRDARERGIQLKTAKFPFLASGKALCEGEPDGFVKVLAAADTGRLLGLHIIGPHATELIAEGALAVRWGLTLSQLSDTIHAHPTLSEALREAAELAGGA
jgi:dihydrolipoamide dehydrogenase